MYFGCISKTTISGILSLLIVVAVALLSSGSPLIGQQATLYITLALGVLKAINGALQSDAVADKQVDGTATLNLNK